ncbi:related to class I alpha-mannosidase [Ramularia collo-cygni]|uniref:alpha-1,2-Mannosidase n=1 Tax=Ramularia collo-cygni TaxID=112498 RepID=A0A2D3V067_9PEZI|nr:related to class I alpha-mannosidase [Ramularia collo-cygni]CZT18067.1 related to class I alpha-mannosidase [Ramularia collo-cygni]
MAAMFSFNRIGTSIFIFTILFIVLLHFRTFRTQHQPAGTSIPAGSIYRLPPKTDPNKFDWARREQRYAVQHFTTLPAPSGQHLPQVQYAFNKTESRTAERERKQRLAQVKLTMARSWAAYRKHAWLSDEVMPITGGKKNNFGGWAATLVDSLDTLWVMDMKKEFAEAVDSVVQIDFSTTSQETVNVFETTIRYLGGFLSAYDLSGDKRLLDKSLELADMLYAAFDTPNRMPISRWDFHAAIRGEEQFPSDHVVLSEVGSLTLEFTRLSQITHDPKWYDAVARIMDVLQAQQYKSLLPGLWPTIVNSRDMEFFSQDSGQVYSLAALSDSLYEYLPKMYALLGGSTQYAQMYFGAMDAIIQYSLFRPMVKEKDQNILITGALRVEGGEITVQPELQHLVCFAGGMFALAGKLFSNDTHVEIGSQLTNGCVWAYGISPTGIMPEKSNVVACARGQPCEWDESRWHQAVYNDLPFDNRNTNATETIRRQRLPAGISAVNDPKYLLRPEAIESVFIMYRTTGDRALQDTAWKMFRSVYAHTRTDIAHAAIVDVYNKTAPKDDSMESFWTAETLKYYYLIFSEPDVISLDDFVFNTEAHPLRRIDSIRGGGW